MGAAAASDDVSDTEGADIFLFDFFDNFLINIEVDSDLASVSKLRACACRTSSAVSGGRRVLEAVDFYGTSSWIAGVIFVLELLRKSTLLNPSSLMANAEA